MNNFYRFLNMRSYLLFFVLVCAFANKSVFADDQKVRSDLSGDGVSVYQFINVNGGGEIYANYFVYSTGTWGTPVSLSDSTANATTPKFAISRDTGNAVAIWYSTDVNGVDSIQTSQYNHSTFSWSSPSIVQADGGVIAIDSDYSVSISDDASSSMLVQWVYYNNGQYVIGMGHATLGSDWVFP